VSGSRIDYILASPGLAYQVSDSHVVSVPGLATDHCLLFTSFSTGMLTKCVRQSLVRKFTKAQSVWNFGAMLPDDWMQFRQVSESLLDMQLLGTPQEELAALLQQESVDSVWGTLSGVLDAAAVKTIPQ
jgi:hypothetical protein